jgi:hypothetical protein
VIALLLLDNGSWMRGNPEIMYNLKSLTGEESGWFTKPDGMRMPVSGGMRYAPKLSTRSKRKR